MLVSRGAFALRSLRLLRSTKTTSITQQPIRKSHNWFYRVGGHPSANVLKVAELAAAFGWWWVLWHIFTEPGHIIGEFPFPDATKWTDEELGIPPEDE